MYEPEQRLLKSQSLWLMDNTNKDCNTTEENSSDYSWSRKTESVLDSTFNKDDVQMMHNSCSRCVSVYDVAGLVVAGLQRHVMSYH